MNKADQIQLLHRFAAAAKKQGADYLADLLTDLAPTFERDMRADHGSCVTLADYCGAIRQLRQDKQQLKTDVETSCRELRELKEAEVYQKRQLEAAKDHAEKARWALQRIGELAG